MDGSEFEVDLRRRVREAQWALDEAKATGELYAADVRSGELDSLLRLAMENGIDLSRGVAHREGGR